MSWCDGCTNGSLPEPAQQGHLLIGPPGSGKSTLAAILAPLLGARIVSSDDLRRQLWGDADVQGPWTELEPLLHGAITCAFAEGDNVLLDATHAQRNWRSRLMQSDLNARQLQWFGWWLQTPLNQCLAWNRSRQRQVPETVIRAMHQRLATPPDRPDVTEGFTSLFQLNPADGRPNDEINRALQILRHEER